MTRPYRKAAHVTGVMMLLLVVAAAAEAETVRGMLIRQTPQGAEYPAQGVGVTVNRPDLGRSGFTYSGPDGMYYLYDIPPGQYTLEVWVYPDTPPWVFDIVVHNQPTTDIGPIYVP